MPDAAVLNFKVRSRDLLRFAVEFRGIFPCALSSLPGLFAFGVWMISSSSGGGGGGSGCHVVGV